MLETSLIPRSRPASRRLQYGTASDRKLGEGLGTRLVGDRMHKVQLERMVHITTSFKVHSCMLEWLFRTSIVHNLDITTHLY